MNDSYQLVGWPRWRLLLLAVLLLGSALAAQAQSGPYGNEWIVSGQPYYKIKVWRDGMYRLDYAYLSKLGAGAVAPSQLQVWRRGKELAVYQGGNSAVLDNSTFLEFYGQRNDGALDRDYYKNPRDQANPHFSFFTDTASYFITWASRPGKRMAQPTAAGGAPHAWRLQTTLKIHADGYLDAPNTTYLPWLEAGEGFFSGLIYGSAAASVNDSILRAVATTATTPPRAEVVISGSSDPIAGHRVAVRVETSTGLRELGRLNFPDFTAARGKYNLLFSDINSSGQIRINSDVYQGAASGVGDGWRYAYSRLTVPQQPVWFADRASLTFKNDSLLAGVATYEIDNIPTTVAGFDVHDPWNVQRITPAAAQTLGASARRYVFPSATTAQSRRLLLADESRLLTPAAAQRVNFRAMDPALPNFIVITHPNLLKGSGAVTNAALAYAGYRASAAGGRYDTLVVTAPQLYDQFHYGERSILALRHFALWLGDKSPATQAKYLLLLGKGISPGTPLGSNDFGLGYFGVYAGNSTRYQGEAGVDLVPTTSRAPSDVFLSSDWPHNNYTPRLITGRLVTTTPDEVLAYLDKLRTYEAQIAPSLPNPESWHKNVIQLAGGHTAPEFAEFGGYMDYYKRQIQAPLFGGNVTQFKRTTVNTGNVYPVENNIAPQVNAGVQLISYFGHGSPNYADLQIGDVLDPLQGYKNTGRYPVMMYSGCGAGACFFSSRTFGSDWVLAPGKGAIGMLAETGFSYAYLIDPMEKQLNQLLFNDPAWFGRPIAEAQMETIRRLQTTSLFRLNTPETTQQLMSVLWQGDPAVRMFAPAKPDLVASNAALSLTPVPGQTSVMATSGSFVLNVGVSNPARITRDSLEIRVTRQYPDGTKTQYVYNGITNKAFAQAFRRDTVYAITLPNTGNVFGDNTFTVEVDYRNKIAELDETNNTATLRYAFLRSGLTLLSPTEFAVVGTTQPRLVAQSNNLNEVSRSYDVQVDSVSTFDSRGGLRSTTVTAQTVMSYIPTPLSSPRDSTVWYWRVRFTNPGPAEDKNWVTGSFRVIPGAAAGGWSQSHNGQFGRDQLTGVAVAAPSNRWSFAGPTAPMQLRTAGGGPKGSGPTFVASGGTILTDPQLPPYVGDCGVGVPNLLAVVLDHNTLRRIPVPGGGYPTCGQNGQTFYHFGNVNGDTLGTINNNQGYRDALLKFLDNVPDGAYVLLASENRVRFADAALATVRQKLATTLGSKLITQLKNGEPWVIVAQKQASGGLLLAEKGPDATLGTPTYSQAISLDANLPTAGTNGQVVSTLIGPARQWQALFNEVRPGSSTGSYTLSLVGVDTNSNEQVLQADIKTKRLDLSGYSAATYPYMRLKLTLRDTANRVPPQLRQWLLTYKGLPEGVVRRDLVAASAYDAATLKQQATNKGELSFPVKFDNVAPDPFASRLQVQVSLYDANNMLVKYPNGKPVQSALISAPRDLGAGDSVLTIPASLLKLDVKGVFGTFTPVAVVNPQLQPEQYYFNNELRLPTITVADNNVPPTLDVAVDGRHILNGELVSPTPTVLVQLKDEDRLRFVNKPDYFTIYLQKVGDATATVVNVRDPNLIRFTYDSTSQKGSVAKLEYTPGKLNALTDGVYTLRIQGHDPSNAYSGTQDYQVKFEVVSHSSITNVYPYPNPVTSKAKFVFTVTGSSLPRNMKIQIMTLTGKVVREIFMAELGPLHIGNNITDYAWDGTDQYGDRLANGTYLYRVLLDDPEADFKRRETAGDKAFKNDWGKLVLLR